MRKTLNRTLASLALVLAGLSLRAGDTGTTPSVDEILQKALERARWSEEWNAESRFTFRVLRISEKLDENGTAQESERRLYEAFPIGEQTFERLVEKDGRPLTPQEEQKELKRRREFENSVRKGESTDAEGQRVSFDEDLVQRYVFRLEGLEQRRGRSTYRLSYEPRSGKLPVNRRIDRALNKADGKIWVDAESFEISAVTFNLREKMKLWWGIIGSISELSGRVERAEIEPDAWLPQRVDFYLKGRILFSSLHRRETAAWSGFERVDTGVEAVSVSGQ